MIVEVLDLELSRANKRFADKPLLYEKETICNLGDLCFDKKLLSVHVAIHGFITNIFVAGVSNVQS